MNFPKISAKVLAPVALALLLAACSSGGSGDPLNGTSWALASIDGAAALPGAGSTAVFESGTIGGSGGCNSYGGTYAVSGGTLSIGELNSTLMACEDQALMDQEAAFLAGLADAQTFRLDGNKLEIVTAGGATLVLDRQP